MVLAAAVGAAADLDVDTLEGIVVEVEEVLGEVLAELDRGRDAELAAVGPGAGGHVADRVGPAGQLQALQGSVEVEQLLGPDPAQDQVLLGREPDLTAGVFTGEVGQGPEGGRDQVAGRDPDGDGPEASLPLGNGVRLHPEPESSLPIGDGR